MKRFFLLILALTGTVHGADLHWSLTDQLIRFELNTNSSLTQVNTNQMAKAKQKTAAYQAALGAGGFLITTKQESKIKRELELLENGKIPLSKTGTEENRILIGYYLMHSNQVTLLAKTQISRSYLGFGAYVESANLVKEYLSVCSNDWHAWRILGDTYGLMGAFQYEYPNLFYETTCAYSNAIRLGDKQSISMLAGVACVNNRFDVVENLVPQLMDLKNAKNISKEDYRSLISILLTYSIATGRENVFVKTLDGVSKRDFNRNQFVRGDIIKGCEIFKGKEIDEIRQRMGIKSPN